MFVLLILLLGAARLYADGCFVWDRGADLTEPSQKAIIYFKDGKEVLVLQVKYEGPAEDFAWIVPLPAKPEVAAIAADKSPFAEISLYTQRRVRWGFKGRDDAQGPAVTVLERKIVGVYDVAIVAASRAGALTNWLNNNGYAFPKQRNDVLEHYTQKKWVYVAMRIDSKALESHEVKKLRTGELQPIRFEFSAEEMVYPLKISSVNSGETEVLLYLLADAPMAAKSEHKRPGFSIEENICQFPGHQDPAYGTFRKARGEELPLTWKALGVPKDKEFSLCKYRSVYKVEDMTDDLVFERFEPVSYWKERLRKAEVGQYWWVVPCASSVLAYHDANLFCSLAREQDKHMKELLASYPKTPMPVLMDLARDEELSVRLELVRNTNIPVDLLAELAEDKDKEVRLAVLSHPKTSVDTFRKLAQDKSQDVRLFVASSNRTPVDLLCKLAQDNSAKVRERLVFNRNTPADAFRTLAEDKEHSIQLALARSPYVPSDVLGKLAESEDNDVRWHVALRSTIPLDILNKLAKDKSEGVRMRVAYNPNTPDELLEQLAYDKSQDVRTAAAGNPKTPTDALLRLAEGKDAHVRMGAASNPNIPVEALWKLANDSDKDVRTMVALNPNTQEDVLRALAKDNDSYVSELAGSALKKRGH
jgi:hypothetical protein